MENEKFIAIKYIFCALEIIGSKGNNQEQYHRMVFAAHFFLYVKVLNCSVLLAYNAKASDIFVKYWSLWAQMHGSFCLCRMHCLPWHWCIKRVKYTSSSSASYVLKFHSIDIRVTGRMDEYKFTVKNNYNDS